MVVYFLQILLSAHLTPQLNSLDWFRLEIKSPFYRNTDNPKGKECLLKIEHFFGTRKTICAECLILTMRGAPSRVQY